MFLSRLVYNYIRMEPIALAIKLTPSEQLLFSTLQQFKTELGLTTVMRVAGGWVRDKVLLVSCRSWAASPTISILPLIT